jgi:hypothetical protein
MNKVSPVSTPYGACLAHPDEAADAGYDLSRVEKMFMKIG